MHETLAWKDTYSHWRQIDGLRERCSAVTVDNINDTSLTPPPIMSEIGANAKVIVSDFFPNGLFSLLVFVSVHKLKNLLKFIIHLRCD